MKTAPLKRTDRLQTTQHANRTVVPAGIGNRVDMRTGRNGGKTGIAAGPSRKRISDGIIAQFQSGLAAQTVDERSRPLIRFRKNHARRDRWCRFRDITERLQFRG